MTMCIDAALQSACQQRHDYGSNRQEPGQRQTLTACVRAGHAGGAVIANGGAVMRPHAGQAAGAGTQVVKREHLWSAHAAAGAVRAGR